MFVSVIICTYNPKIDYLMRTLDAIAAQDLDMNRWELLIVDNNSTVPVRNLAVVQERNIRVVFEEKQGLSAARACGMNNTRGDILVYFDDDNIPKPNYLSNVCFLFEENNKLGIVSGNIEPEYEVKPEPWFFEWEGSLAIRRFSPDRLVLTMVPIFTEYFPIGAGMSIRRELLVKYYQSISDGGAYISGRSGASLTSGEDLDLDFFAIQQNYQIGISGQLSIKHLIPSKRVKIEYLSALTTASTKSSGEVNSKWKSVFGQNVIEVFNNSRTKLIIRCFFHWLLQFRPAHLIRYKFFREVIRITNAKNI